MHDGMSFLCSVVLIMCEEISLIFSIMDVSEQARWCRVHGSTGTKATSFRR